MEQASKHAIAERNKYYTILWAVIVILIMALRVWANKLLGTKYETLVWAVSIAILAAVIGWGIYINRDKK